MHSSVIDNCFEFKLNIGPCTERLYAAQWRILTPSEISSLIIFLPWSVFKEAACHPV